MPHLLCKGCGKSFYSKHSIQKYHNKECYYREQTGAIEFQSVPSKIQGRKKKRPYEKNWKPKKYIKLRVTKRINRKGFYVKNKEHYQNQVIPYSQSPTGKAYIGINKEPLMPNKNGIGFQGVLIQDDSRQFIQCSSCGKWMKKITNHHLALCSKGRITTTGEYKKVFGLYAGEGLVSDETSLKLAEATLKNRITREKFIENKEENIKKAIRAKAQKNTSIISMKRREWENKHGSCPEQIKARLKEFILGNRELPRNNNRGRSLYKVLARRFGSFGKGLQYYGLPRFQRVGTNYKYTFPDYTVYSYNINKMYDREKLFTLMKGKCTLLQSSNDSQ